MTSHALSSQSIRFNEIFSLIENLALSVLITAKNKPANQSLTSDPGFWTFFLTTCSVDGKKEEVRPLTVRCFAHVYFANVE